MLKLRRLPGALAIFAVLACSPSTSNSASLDASLLERLVRAAPKIDRTVLKTAFLASRCAVSSGDVAMPKRLAVIDFSLPSSEERLWIFDLANGELLLRDLVAHGENSGVVTSTEFSNVEGSHQSSIGLFQASESYIGKHGYSLRLDGLEAGVNDHARQRAIVIHGADYVSQSWVDRYGRIGRSHGCPAVDQEVISQVVDNLKGGQLVFKYYPDQRWLRNSEYLKCDSSRIAAHSPGPADRS